MTTKRMLALAVVLASGAACSSSSPSKSKDGGADGGTAGKDGGAAGKDGGSVAGKDGGGTDGGSDTPIDMAMTDTGGDAAALTPQQTRGAYLVNAVIGCSDCHTPMLPTGLPDTSKFLAGNASFVVLPNGDKLGSRNLTSDATGLKNISDADVKSFLLTGQRTVGTSTEVLNPTMPYYVFHNMTSDDADAIVAYLRTVPPVVNMIPKRDISFDVAAPANPLDPNLIPLPLDTYTNRESALRGRYLAAESGLCVECHTPHLATGADVLDTTKFFAGGEDYSSLFAATLMIHPVSKNLTSDATTGLGSWALSDVVAALSMGKAKDGSGICPPMPTADYVHVTPADQTDIANYIKSLPPVVHAIADMCVFPPVAPADGGASEAGNDAGASEAGGDAGGDASGN
jgi:mono/diheme cytochrome c family protein